MITIPNHTAEWLTDESFRQFRVIDKAWARVYNSAKAGNVLTWSKCGLTYVLTGSFYEADALQTIYAETLTEADYEKIAEDYKSLYCEHEIASNVWADVLDDWAKEHGWKERDA